MKEAFCLSLRSTEGRWPHILLKTGVPYAKSQCIHLVFSSVAYAHQLLLSSAWFLPLEGILTQTVTSHMKVVSTGLSLLHRPTHLLSMGLKHILSNTFI